MNRYARTCIVSCVLVVMFVVGLPRGGAAQDILKDFNTQSLRDEGSYPRLLTPDGSGRVFFLTATGDLHATNGVQTQSILDVHALFGDSHIAWMKWVGSRLVLASDRLYFLDYINLSAKATAPMGLGWEPAVEMSGHLYFFCRPAGQPGGLYRTDGTVSGTSLVKAVYDPTAGSTGNDLLVDDYDTATSSLRALGGALYFSAGSPGLGKELWKSDGTAAGTMMVHDIHSQGGNSYPGDLLEMGGWVYFHADDGVHGRELWRTDGSVAGTTLVVDIVPGPIGSGVGGLTANGGKLYFQADDGATGPEPWVSDGTAAGTLQLLDIVPGTAGSDPVSITPIGSGVVFSAVSSSGRELWASDGTLSGTRIVADLAPGGSSSDPTELVSNGSQVIFNAQSSQTFRPKDVWITDGTAAGTLRLTEQVDPFWYTATKFTPVSPGTIFVFALDDVTHGNELWVTDGTVDGTSLLANLKVPLPGATESAFVDRMIDAHGQAFIAVGDDLQGGRELWLSDGSGAGTTLVRDLQVPGSSYSNVAAMGLLDHRLLMWVRSSLGTQLWVSDRTAEGTMPIKDLTPIYEYGTREYSSFARLGDRALFFCLEPGYRAGLWSTDGSSDGTLRLAGIGSATADFYPRNPTRLGDQLFFVVGDEGDVTRLWSSDGTSEGTSPRTDLAPGVVSRCQAVSDRQIFFVMDDGVSGSELWVSDGGATGTRLVKDISPGAASTSFSDERWAFADGKLYFVADDGVSGHEPWVTDGTAAGTRLLLDVEPAGSSDPRGLTAVGDRVFFVASTAVAGQELWVTDGSAAGTRLVLDIWPGPTPGILDLHSDLTAVSTQRVFFFASDGVYGDELWQSDGTAAGTFMVKDIFDGFRSSAVSESHALLSNGKLLFMALEPYKGFELWSCDPGASSKEIGFASGMTRPRLRASEARIGGTLEISIDSDVPSTAGFIAFADPAVPFRLDAPGFLAADHQFYLDPITSPALLVIPGGTDVNGDWSTLIPVPSTMLPMPPYCVQAGLWNGNRIDLTNAVHFTVGH